MIMLRIWTKELTESPLGLRGVASSARVDRIKKDMFLSAALHIPETERLLLVRRIANWYVKNLDQRIDRVATWTVRSCIIGKS